MVQKEGPVSETKGALSLKVLASVRKRFTVVLEKAFPKNVRFTSLLTLPVVLQLLWPRYRVLSAAAWSAWRRSLWRAAGRVRAGPSGERWRRQTRGTRTDRASPAATTRSCSTSSCTTSPSFPAPTPPAASTPPFSKFPATAGTSAPTLTGHRHLCRERVPTSYTHHTGPV